MMSPLIYLYVVKDDRIQQIGQSSQNDSDVRKRW